MGAAGHFGRTNLTGKRDPSPMKKTPGLRPGADFNGCPARSVELVVQADPQDVIGDLRAEVAHHEAAAERGDRRDERAAVDRAEVDVEIFDLAGPVAAKAAFEAGANGP